MEKRFGSMGLFGDSLDMLADSFVYGLSLYVVGKAVSKNAKFSGYIQFILA
jgi:Co/Zn/Cd efflux system component